MGRKKKRSPFKADKGAFITREMIESQAFRSLSGTAKNVYFDFLLKRELVEPEGKPEKRQERHIVANNGKILYPYTEALRKDISRATFSRALSKLVETGFIDIKHSGGGYDGDSSRYAISERWKKFGAEGFEQVTRPKDARQSKKFKIYHKERKAKKVIEMRPRPKLIKRKLNRIKYQK